MTARVLRLPVTASGRVLIRDAMRVSNGRWDFPDGSSADTLNWDELANEIDLILADLDRIETEMREAL